MLFAMGEHPGRPVGLAGGGGKLRLRGARRTVDYRDTRQLRLQEG